MPERAEVLERLGRAAADLWATAQETPDLGPEQHKAIEAAKAGKAVPRVVLQLGSTLQVSVDVLFEYGDRGVVRIVYVEVPPEAAAN